MFKNCRWSGRKFLRYQARPRRLERRPQRLGGKWLKPSSYSIICFLFDAKVNVRCPRASFGILVKQATTHPEAAIEYLWAARRLQDLKPWQELWIANGQHGFRGWHSTENLLWKVSLELELSLLSGEPLFGVSFDYAKCFDLIPHSILLNLMAELGLHKKILGPMHSMYCNLRRRFKFVGGVGDEFVATNGILQGCPLSVIFVNALMSIWSKSIEGEIPETCAES